MGFFSKMQSMHNWSTEDLRDEISTLTAKLAREPWPWDDPPKLDALQARHKEYRTKITAMEEVLAGRGLGAQMSPEEFMKTLKNRS